MTRTYQPPPSCPLPPSEPSTSRSPTPETPTPEPPTPESPTPESPTSDSSSSTDMSTEVQALRSICDWYHLPTDGNQNELEKRLKNYKCVKVAAILVRTVKIPNEDDAVIKEFCAKQLMREKDDAVVSKGDTHLRWGNAKGLDVLEKLDTITDQVGVLIEKNEVLVAKNEVLEGKIGVLEGEVGVLKGEVRELRCENGGLKDKIDTLEEDNEELKTSSERQQCEIDGLKEISNGYFIIRSRFFAWFLRDVQQKVISEEDQKALKEGHSVAHLGDALTDARMLEKGVRHDGCTFSDIYGLSFEQVLSIRDDTTTLRVFSDWASVKAAKGFVDSSDYDPAYDVVFTTFRDAFLNSGKKSGYLDDESGPVAQAYRAFETLNTRVQQARRDFRGRGSV